MEALDRLSSVAKENPLLLAQILTPLYVLLKEQKDPPQLRIVIAQLYIEHQRYTEAFYELEELFEQNPLFTQTYFLLYKIYNKHKLKAKIQHIFESAFEEKIYDSAVIDLLSKIYSQSQQAKKSVQFFETLSIQKPDNIQFHKTLTELYIQTLDYPKACLSLRKWIQLYPDDAKMGIEKCEKMTKNAPHHKEVKELLVELYLQRFNIEKANEHLQGLLKINAENADNVIKLYKESLEKFPGNAPLTLGLCDAFSVKGLYTDAVETLKNLLENKTAPIPVLIRKLSEILEKNQRHAYGIQILAECFIQNHQEKQALEVISALIQSQHFDEASVIAQLEKIKIENPQEKEWIEYNFVQLEYHKENFEKSLAGCAALKETPFKLKAQLMELKIYKKTNRKREKTALLTTLLEENRHTEFIYNLAQKAVLEDISETIETHLKSDPQDANTQFEIGQLYHQKGELETARSYLEKIAKNSPSYLKAQTLMGRILIELGQYTAAKNHLKPLVEKKLFSKKNASAPAQFLLSLACFNKGETQEALDLSLQTLKNTPNYPKAEKFAQFLKENQHSANKGIAIGGLFSGKTLLLVSIPRQKTASKKENSRQSTVAISHNNQGVTLFLEQKEEEAKDAFKLAIGLEPKSTIFHLNLGFFYITKNKMKEALAEIQMAEKLGDEMELAYHLRSLLYFKGSEWELAMDYTQKAIAENPKNPLYSLLLGDIYWETGEPEKAHENWKRANQTGLLALHIQRRTQYLKAEATGIKEWLSPKGFWNKKEIPKDA